MPETVRTAVSLDRALFDQADALAARLRVSRSRVVALALKNFLRHDGNRRLLEQIDAAYAETPDPAESKLRERMRRLHSRRLYGQW